MDVDSIALGRDFRQVLQERLGSCDVMFALIGPGWLNATDGSGTRRLENPTDFVRQEIAAALKRNIPVIPVLVQGAQVPPPERLPDDLKDLSYRNGFELGHSTWESDVQEMVKRLGLRAPTTADPLQSPSSTTDTSHEVSTWSARFSWRRFRVAVITALLVGVAGLLPYLYMTIRSRDRPATEIAKSSQLSKETALPSAGVAAMTPLQRPNSTPGGRLAGSGLEFFWPGEDCWDIFRGAERVTDHCGANKQALGAGRYTIKGKFAPVFVPFDVNINAEKPTQISLGGVFEFAWPGQDCWDIFRGAERVTDRCGANKQALGAGRYTIKGKFAAIFMPFTVDIKDGSLTRMAMGGVFEFAWPGGDCWDIFRGAERVTNHCGANKQALSAGRYTIKGQFAQVFEPFEITVVDGAKVVKAP
jgi:hypothetical protein